MALNREPQPEIGELQVQLRTQTRGLIEAVQDFLRMWIPLEERVCGEITAAAEEGRYTRAIRPDPRFETEPGILSKSIENYVNHFDRAIKSYVACVSAIQAKRIAEEELRAYAASGFPMI